VPQKPRKFLQARNGEEEEGAGVAEVHTEEQKMVTRTLEGEAVDGAASRAAGEVAATETARALAVDMRQRRARRLP
jgi:hypothetical protein